MKTAIRTTLAAMLSVLLLPLTVQAQDCASAPEVTVRDINLIPQANIDVLMAAGTGLDHATIFANLTNDIEGTTVKFTAVVLTDWRNSGLSTPNDGVPSRIHVFVRDTSAASMGVGGMGIQIVDDTGAILANDFVPGDVVDICGNVVPFTSSDGKVMQVVPVDQTSIVLAPVPSVPAEDPLRQPVPITIDDIHQELSDGSTQILWTTISDFRGQYVRLENVNVVDSTPDDTGRPDMLMQSVGENTLLNMYDTSMRFRNDRGVCPNCYPNPPYNTRPTDDPFVPPAPGGIVNIQGFLGYVGWDGGYGYSLPASTNFGISPIVDEDLEIIAGPPIITTPSSPEGVPGNEAITITVVVQPGDPSRTITGVDLDYSDTSGGFQQGFGGTVAMVNTAGDTWEGTIPAAPDDIFVFYSVTATDSQGESSTSAEVYYRVLYGGITDIEHIQRTPDGLPGNSPFNGVTTSTDITLDAVVQADFESADGRYIMIQDDPALGEWSGIFIQDDSAPAVSLGDQITITTATIRDNFGLTRLEDVTFSIDGSGSPYAHKLLNTGLLNGDDQSILEAHEGMLLRFDMVEVTDANADGPDDGSGSNFGEFQVASDGSEANEIRVDDLASEIPVDFNINNLGIGYSIAFVQGPWYYSFGNFKLAPTGLSDIGAITVSNEPTGPAVPGTYRLHAAYPNPFNPSTTIRYDVGDAGPVSLKVFDALGREVATLVDANLVPSAYEATFDATGLASGTYVYQLVAGGEVLTGRVTLLK